MKNRGRLKKQDYLITAQEDLRMLIKITDRDIFDYGVQVVVAGWRNDGEDDFADWFEHVYLADDWDGGSFFAGAGGVPGKYIFVIYIMHILTDVSLLYDRY